MLDTPGRFDETVTSRERLREIIPGESGKAALKVVDRIDDICRRYIAASPFVMVATRGADGLLDMSPKGDPAGFVHVLDEHTLVIPDRPGNNRLDTFENVLVNPEVALFFVIPGKGDTLRVSGRGMLVRDAALQEKLAVNGREPGILLVVRVEEAFTHCSKCMVRSGMWKQEKWPDLSDVPTLAEAVSVHIGDGTSAGEIQDVIDDHIRTKLY